MADKIVQIFPKTDFKGLDEIAAEQAAYYGRPDTSKMIFVFGSNESGIHGAGAARFAHQYRGAILGQGVGHHGQSYAIPTKDRDIKSLELDDVRCYVDQFLEYAREHPELQFQVTCIGCGLAGFQHEDIAPMFDGAPGNCWFDQLWAGHIGIRSDRIWGTF